MKPKDILVHYMVTKIENKEVDIEKIIQFIITYIQNHPIYFKYDPSFYNKVLLFGVIGFKKEHIKLQKRLGSDITKFGGTLTVLHEKEIDNG